MVGALALLACAAPSPEPCLSADGCPSSLECIASRCAPAGSDPVPPTTRRAVMAPSRMAVSYRHGSDHGPAVPSEVTFGDPRLGDAALYLRFDVPWHELGRVQSAFLVLRPLPAGLPAPRPLPLEVRLARGDFSPGVLPWRRRPGLESGVGRALAPGRGELPLRIDVTQLLRGRRSPSRAAVTVALFSTEPSAHGIAYGLHGHAAGSPELSLYHSPRSSAARAEGHGGL